MNWRIFLFTTLCFFCLLACTPKENKVNAKKITSQSDGIKKSSNKTSKEQRIDDDQLAKSKELIASASAEEIAAVDVKGKYKMLCQNCHGMNGDVSIAGSKKLTESKASLEESIAQIYFGKGTMMPFKGVMKDHEIVAVAKFVEDFRK